MRFQDMSSELRRVEDYITNWNDFYTLSDQENNIVPKPSELTRCFVFYWGGSKDSVEREEFVLRDLSPHKKLSKERISDVLQIIKKNGVREVGFFEQWLPTKYSAYIHYQRIKQGDSQMFQDDV